MMEYGSIVDAQASLGRNLTMLEVKWFEYTANVSDYYLYSLSTVFVFLALQFATLPTVVFELFQMLRKYKCQPGVKNSNSSIFHCYKSAMLLYFLLVLPFQLSSYPAIKMIGIQTGLPLPSLPTIALQLLVYCMTEDFLNYWIHRWLHTEWAYSNIHHVHHEYTASISFTGFYAHPLEIVILGLPIFLGPAVVPGHMVTLCIWLALRNLQSVEVHSGYEFPWTLSSLIPFYGGAEVHDYHHFLGSKCANNFGSIFTYCDLIYGTSKGYLYYKSRKAKVVNLENEPAVLQHSASPKILAKVKAA